MGERVTPEEVVRSLSSDDLKALVHRCYRHEAKEVNISWFEEPFFELYVHPPKPNSIGVASSYLLFALKHINLVIPGAFDNG